MVKARFREVSVKDGDEIELGGHILTESVTIHADHSEGGMKYIVTWLEGVKE